MRVFARLIKALAVAGLGICVMLNAPVTKSTAGGIASWYGGGEKLNKHTASGEVFDPSDHTCASWDYNFGAILKVTNTANGKSVVVRVNDRGPHKRLGRVIDLSKRAFSEIESLKKGLTIVEIEQVS
ncbi:MAG: septal ring lytic transglycosylase RlpA family protein [Candidatus Omnitrophota bacterium]